MRRLLVVSFVGLVLAAATAPLVAQQGTSEIGGKALDDQGGVLPGVTIVITNVETGRTREIISGGDITPALAAVDLAAASLQQNGVLR